MDCTAVWLSRYTFQQLHVSTEISESEVLSTHVESGTQLFLAGKITITIFTSIIVGGKLGDIIHRKGLKINRLQRPQAMKSGGI
jgi:hypothetical protein